MFSLSGRKCFSFFVSGEGGRRRLLHVVQAVGDGLAGRGPRRQLEADVAVDRQPLVHEGHLPLESVLVLEGGAVVVQSDLGELLDV